MPSTSTFIAKDMRKLRLDRYTTAAANETRSFIEECLGEQLTSGDLLEALKDGIALCKIINKVVPETLRFKTNATMPFVQMENISLFLEACKNPPFNLQSHDVFLTVDLYECKDPAQVLQCLAAFSRAAHKIDPVRFPNPIGKRSNMSPQSTGTPRSSSAHNDRTRITSRASSSSLFSYSAKPTLKSTLTGSSGNENLILDKSTGCPLSSNVSSWSNKIDQKVTSPAWNIVQYGYLGGASQGNLGVSFGGRRQITSAGPHVPSLPEKEKRRREKIAEENKLRLESEEIEKRQREINAAKKAHARIEEEKKLAEEAEILKERKRSKLEEENRKWKEEEERWRLEEEKRRHEELEAEAKFNEERSRLISARNARWRDQMTSHHPKSRAIKTSSSPERTRIMELECELEQARAREREYEKLRQTNLSAQSFHISENNDFSVRSIGAAKARALSHSRLTSSSFSDKDGAWGRQRQESLGSKWSFSDSSSNLSTSSSPSLATESLLSTKSSRPLPEPKSISPISKQRTGPRPLPDPADYAVITPKKFAKISDNFHDSTSQSEPQSQSPKTPVLDNSSTYTSNDTDRLPQKLQPMKPRSGGLLVKSLLEREMEMERQRQQEWEEGQLALKENIIKNKNDVGGGVEGRWDVNQWTGFTGGDSQNKGLLGIGSGRRQIVGPRPPPSCR
ncbi:hypothetical protein K3495_g1258 [Podosphaera aphanis]|nr:hypothetical protein K3495_g1258 [Podosphaera aphanis]